MRYITNILEYIYNVYLLKSTCSRVLFTNQYFTKQEMTVGYKLKKQNKTKQEYRQELPAWWEEVGGMTVSDWKRNIQIFYGNFTEQEGNYF